jgi:hypothetical protein
MAREARELCSMSEWCAHLEQLLQILASRQAEEAQHMQQNDTNTALLLALLSVQIQPFREPL